LYEALRESDILVRYFDQNRLQDKLRITVGTDAENKALITKLRQLL
jgi:histidinol-phosphate aminotransferase